MKKQTIKVGVSNVINIVMVEEAQSLQEVVVVSYGQKRSLVSRLAGNFQVF
jgi:hypothetical protein